LVLLPCYIGTAVPGRAQLTPPLPDLESELWLITHPDLRNTARVRAFLDSAPTKSHAGGIRSRGRLRPHSARKGRRGGSLLPAAAPQNLR